MIGRRAVAIALAAALSGAGGACGRGEPRELVPEAAEAVVPLQVGERAPDVSFQSLDGERVALASLLDAGPIALVFYRGGW